MKQYKLLNNIFGWLVFAISTIVYILTLESTASFWDCGEFISSAYKLEVGHPPGNPIFMLTARFFANFASSPSEVAYMVNLMSGLLSGGTILLLFWTITHLARKIVVKDGQEMMTGQMIAILGSGLVGSLIYAFSDTFWFSAVEGEVYAYSSFCTALVFWLILKWETVADEPHANRYIVLIAYLIGISIAVHLLNLLCIPAIVLVYYYKKYPNANLKGSIIALLISFALIVILLYGLIPGFMKVTGWAELFCVNVLGMPYNAGAILYSILVLASIAWGIIETFKQKSVIRMKVSFIISIILVGIPFIGDHIIVGILLSVALIIALFYRKTVAVKTLNTILLCVLVIFIGYSSYALIIIRSSANPPMDQNSPKDVFTLASYLNREQYGDRPLLSGYTFVSEVARDNSGNPVSNSGPAIWRQSIKTDDKQKDKYEIIGHKEDYVYTPELDMFFTRMYSRDPRHVSAYKEWTNFKGKPTQVKSEGQVKVVAKPTFSENLKFFLDYQLNYMYWRYFMWNFSGRQNDIQGNGEVQNGNWITGFNFIDKYIAGDQTNLPPDMENNKGRNVFYMLPLLLGLAGLLFQAYSGKKGIEGFWVTFFLFFMTGIAIVIYLNQTPYQPRERDYAYAGSFYAYSIWIGLGVAAVARGIQYLLVGKNKAGERENKCSILAASLATLLCICVPIQVISQTWDDHDRSGRYVGRDFGMNYLSCVEPDGVIFTNGDNDTFPLWYAQEVEGYRTDVRVCNLSYLQTDWYIDQMKRPAYESSPLPISMRRDQYAQGKRDYAYFYPLDGISGPASLDAVMAFLLSDNEATKQIPGVRDRLDLIPTREIFLPVDSSAVIKSGTVSGKDVDRIVDRMNLSFPNKSGLSKSEIAILDMINTNAKDGWKRPIYYSVTVGNDMYLNLDKYFRLEGLAYRVVPEDNLGAIDTEKMYDNMMNKFKWGGIENPNVYLDENVRRMCRTQRMMFASLVDALVKEGKKDKALKALDYSLKVIPKTAVSHSDGISVNMGLSYFEIDQPGKGIALLNEVADNALATLRWHKNLTPNQFRTVGNDNREQKRLLYNVLSIYNTHGQKKLLDQYLNKINDMGISMEIEDEQ